MICNTQFRNKRTTKQQQQQQKLWNISHKHMRCKEFPQNINTTRRNVRPRAREKEKTAHECQRTIVFRLENGLLHCISIECNCVRSISRFIFYCSCWKVWALLRIGSTKEFSVKKRKRNEKLIAVYWLWPGRSTIIFIVRSFTFMISVGTSSCSWSHQRILQHSKDSFFFISPALGKLSDVVYSNAMLRSRQTLKLPMQLKLKSKFCCSVFYYKRENKCGNKSYHLAKFMPINLFAACRKVCVLCTSNSLVRWIRRYR